MPDLADAIETLASVLHITRESPESPIERSNKSALQRPRLARAAEQSASPLEKSVENYKYYSGAVDDCSSSPS